MSFDVRTGDYDRAGRESRERQARPVKDWLIWTILATLLCGCVPIGLLGINYAMQAKSKLQAGDWLAAEQYAEKAKICVYFCMSWGLLQIFVGVGFVVFSFVAALVQAAMQEAPTVPN